MRRRVAVIGAGPAGLTAALALRRLGCEVAVFEKNRDLHRLGGGVVLQPNGLRVLDALGLSELLAPIMRPARRLAIERTAGVWQADFDYARLPLPEQQAANVARAELLEYLASAVEWADVPVLFGRRCAGVDQGPEGAVVRFAHGQPFECDLVVAADGARSATCEAAGIGGRVRPAGLAFVHGVVARYTPDATVRELRTGDGRSCTIFPLLDGQTAFACQVSVAGWRELLRQNLDLWIDGWHAESVEVGALLDAVADPAALGYSEAALVTRPRWWRGATIAIGAAAHAMTPFLHQSVSAGMVDAIVLARLVAAASDADLGSVGRAYQQLRAPFVSRAQRAAYAADLGWRPRSWLVRALGGRATSMLDWHDPQLGLLAAGVHPSDEPFLTPLR